MNYIKNSINYNLNYVKNKFSIGTCAICLNDIYTIAKKNFNKCNENNHPFHTQCIKKWLKTHTTCPLCKLDYKNKFKKIFDKIAPKNLLNKLNDKGNVAFNKLPLSKKCGVLWAISMARSAFILLIGEKLSYKLIETQNQNCNTLIMTCVISMSICVLTEHLSTNALKKYMYRINLSFGFLCHN